MLEVRRGYLTKLYLLEFYLNLTNMGEGKYTIPALSSHPVVGYIIVLLIIAALLGLPEFCTSPLLL